MLWERGIKTKLISEELNSHSTEWEIESNRTEIRECIAEDNRRVAQYHSMDADYHREVAKARGRDYDGSHLKHSVRVYFHPAQIVATLEKHGIPVVSQQSDFGLNRAIVSKNQPHHCFLMVSILCEHTHFRRAQFEWLKRLSQTPPEPLVTSMEVSIL